MRGTRSGRSKPRAAILNVLACSGTSCATAVVPPDWRQLKFVATTSMSEKSFVNDDPSADLREVLRPPDKAIGANPGREKRKGIHGGLVRPRLGKKQGKTTPNT